MQQFTKSSKKVWPLARLDTRQLKARWLSLTRESTHADPAEIARIRRELVWRGESLPYRLLSDHPQDVLFRPLSFDPWGESDGWNASGVLN